MKTRILEATNGINWGRFVVGRLDSEWAVPSSVDGRSVLLGTGADPRHLLVLDLVTREGAIFRPGGYVRADLEKHPIRVCPLFAPFLEWLYQQDTADLDALPALVTLPLPYGALVCPRCLRPMGQREAVAGEPAPVHPAEECTPVMGSRVEVRWGQHWRAGLVQRAFERLFVVKTEAGPRRWVRYNAREEWRWPGAV